MNCCDGNCDQGRTCECATAVDIYGRALEAEDEDLAAWFEFGDKLVLWSSALIFASFVVASIWERAVFGMWGGL